MVRSPFTNMSENEYPPLVGKDHPITKLPKSFPTTICEELTLGIDIGVGSCGLALIHKTGVGKPVIKGLPDFPSRISFLGVRTFDVPETKEKTGIKLKNPERRQTRLLRRGISRRAKRMRAIRKLLVTEGLLPPDYNVQAPQWKKFHEAATPWDWRVDALENLVEPRQWAAMLIHFSKHRGFRSNKKSDRTGDSEDGKVLEASKKNREALEHYQTLGEMFANDYRFAERKRNRDGSYTSVVLRADLISEIQILFGKQRAFGNPNASDTFEAEYIKTLQTQLPLQNPVKLLEDCPFVPGELRGSRCAPSFELSRALQRLNTLTLRSHDGMETPLRVFAGSDPEAYPRFLVEFGKTQKMTWQQLRQIFQIPENLAFKELSISQKPKGKSKAAQTEKPAKSVQDLEKQDFVNRGATGCAHATSIFRKLLGDSWQTITRNGLEPLDLAAFSISFYEVIEDENTDETVLGQLKFLCAAWPQLIEAVTLDLQSEVSILVGFKGSVAVSSQVSRSLIPLLAQGLVYSDAMAAAGYNHSDSNFTLKSITNPVVQSVVRETMKQIVHLIDETGVIPGKINIELGRDLGKSIDERNEIDKGIRDRTTERNANRQQASEILGRKETEVTDDELLRYELFVEQGGYCPYSGDTIPTTKDLFEASYQIDHILPRSRSHDNSYFNKVLVFTASNQNKKNQTTFEFFNGISPNRWQEFQTIVGSMRGIRGRKRRNLLDATFAERESEFISRNLNDTRYVGRVVTAFLQTIYTIAGEKMPNEKESNRRINVRPGALTAMIRKAWGLENLKKDLNGKRIGDKHHAVDALICACIEESQSQFVTALSKAWRDMETLHDHCLIPKKLPLPWPDFRNTVVAALNSIQVSRRESRKGKGSLHNDTVYGRDDAGIYWKRTSLIGSVGTKRKANFTKLEQIESIRGAREFDMAKPRANPWFRNALLGWIQSGSPTDKPPVSPDGKPIVKVFIEERSNSMRQIDRGWVTNGDMIRCDVLSKNGKYALIPVYSHHLGNSEPPNRAIKAFKAESDWHLVDDTYQFEFSLWKNSRFRVTERPKRGNTISQVLEGNYSGLDRTTGKITYNDTNDHGADSLHVSPVTSLKFEKLYIDRLGRVFPIPRERRTWRGRVCI